jgi:hypothetical protein
MASKRIFEPVHLSVEKIKWLLDSACGGDSSHCDHSKNFTAKVPW